MLHNSNWQSPLSLRLSSLGGRRFNQQPMSTTPGRSAASFAPVIASGAQSGRLRSENTIIINGQRPPSPIPSSASQLAALNTMTNVRGQPIRGELRAQNNVITLDAGQFFRFDTGNGQSMIVSSLAPDFIGVPWGEITEHFGTDIGVISHHTYNALNRYAELFVLFFYDDGWSLHNRFSPAEVLNFASRLGIQPGWVELRNQGNVTRFYMEENGQRWSELHIAEVRSQLDRFESDWEWYGLTEESVIEVNGQEFRFDPQSKSFNIPRDMVALSYGIPSDVHRFLPANPARLNRSV